MNTTTMNERRETKMGNTFALIVCEFSVFGYHFVLDSVNCLTLL